jgi:RNA polymerase sigma-70 factor, ECF subfamily
MFAQTKIDRMSLASRTASVPRTPSRARETLESGRSVLVKVAVKPAHSAAPDAVLIAWSAAGDRRAFDEIVTRHGRFALRVALRLVTNVSVAEELAQESFLRAWEQRGRFDPLRARFTTWLYRIVANQCVDYLRRKRPEPMPENFDLADPTTSIEASLEAKECHDTLQAALGTLTARQRAAMVLVYDEGMSGAETARVLGLSAKAVERLLARARRYLRKHLAGNLHDHPYHRT